MLQETMNQKFRFSRWAKLLLLTILLSSNGCKDNPGKWPTEKVSSKVAESLKLSDLSLSPTSNGLEGSGMRSDGETVSVIVKLIPESSKITWNAKGDRGFVEDGSYEILTQD